MKKISIYLIVAGLILGSSAQTLTTSNGKLILTGKAGTNTTALINKIRG